jgi:hypothetical protein
LSENEKLVDLVQDCQAETQLWRGQYEQMQSYHKSYIEEMQK